jgi:hypothetical protein
VARILLGIASSVYEDAMHLPLLRGTEPDARNIERALLDSSLGDYNADLSKLLISPSLSEVQDAIKDLLFAEDKIDCFTLYFAGHGISHMGTYYLCVRDTFTNKLSATALPLNYIFNVINETQPLQTNIIIDACAAGGLVDDLGSLIKPEVFGNAGSPSVSLFGSCMRDEEAEEEDAGGVATLELLKYLNGEEKIDTRWPFLDLVQIGRNVSVDLKNKDYGQTPVIWGLSLTGISTFSKNPHYQSAAFTASNTIDLHTFISSDVDLIQNEKEKIWLHYLEIPKTGATPTLIQSLVSSVKDLKEKGMSPAKIGSFLLGTAEGFSMRVSERPDVFSEIEVLASCGAAFLPIIEELNAEQSFWVLIDRISQSASRNFEMLEADLTEHNALMSNRSGINELYALPIRISKILGWMALVQKIQVNLGVVEIISDTRIKFILGEISKNYSSSFVCVSDEQAPFLMLFSQMKGFAEGDEIFLSPLRYYLNDFIQRKGKIASSNISGEDVLQYLICRNVNDYTSIRHVLAQPSELLSVLLDAANNGNMDDEVDPFMQKIDHLSLNIYIAEDISTFSEVCIESGINITMQVGGEVGAGVFTIRDFRENFANTCIPHIEILQKDKKPETLVATGLASFMMPDRVPWGLKKV